MFGQPRPDNDRARGLQTGQLGWSSCLRLRNRIVYAAMHQLPVWIARVRSPANILIGLFAGGLLVRLLGLRLGLPYLHHWDECWVVWSARHMLETNSDVPTSYQYGAPLSSLIAWTVRLSNALPSLPHITYSDEVALRWIGRAISVAICSTGTIALYVAGVNVSPRLGNDYRTGLYSAAAYAFGYELVTHARYAVTDGILAALCAWTIALGAKYLRTRRLTWALGSLLCAATAFAFKVTALPTVMIPVLCLTMAGAPKSRRARMVYRALWMGAVPFVFIGFLCLNPHYIDRWQQATQDLTQRIAQTRNGWFSHYYVHESGVDHLSSVLWALLGHTLSRSVFLASVLGAISVSGIMLALRQRRKVVIIAVIHATFIVASLALLTRTLVLRNYLTAVPVMCLGVGIGLEAFSRCAARFGEPSAVLAWLAAYAPPLLLLLLGAVTFRDCIANQRLSQDARIRAIDWISERSQGKSVTVSVTPSVTGPPENVGSDIQSRLKRPSLRFIGQIQTCESLTRTRPDYVVSASYRGPDTPAIPFDERWYFMNCPGYDRVAFFEANPYESTFWVYPTWAGRVSTVALARHALAALP